MTDPIDVMLAWFAADADCRRRRVGAAIVLDGQLVGRGWNGLPDGSCLLGQCPRGLLTYEQQPAFANYENNCRAVHAEEAALREAGDKARGATIYVTCEPCPGCAKAIEDAGVAAVIVRPLSKDYPAATGR